LKYEAKQNAGIIINSSTPLNSIIPGIKNADKPFLKLLSDFICQKSKFKSAWKEQKSKKGILKKV